MACRFEYNGKTYDQDGLAKALENMPPHEAHKYIPGVKNIPDAPFKKTWHELALKRMIRHAAEIGADRLSWTPGEAQAARYDLSKSVDKLAYDPRTGHLQGFKDGGMALDNVVPKDKLADFVGKEAAKNILENPTKKLGNGYHTLEGQDLKVGGEGMKGFYDQIIPKALSKISGEKVKSAELPGKLSNRLGQPPETHSVHYIDIPQALKDKAMQKGFPLFSGNYMYTPVSGNPFEKKKKK